MDNIPFEPGIVNSHDYHGLLSDTDRITIIRDVKVRSNLRKIMSVKLLPSVGVSIDDVIGPLGSLVGSDFIDDTVKSYSDS